LLETFPDLATLSPALPPSLMALGVMEVRMQIDKRRVARIGAVVVVALAAGHLVQTMAARKDAPRPAVEAAMPRPADVVQLAATNQPAAVPVVAKPVLPAAALAKTAPVPAEAIAVADACPVTLDLMADPGAMIGITLLAPCHPSTRVVLQHAGLAVTAQTSLTGTLFLSVPALTADAEVELTFADGTSVSKTIAMDDIAALRRFAVQWQADDAFQLYGYQGATAVSATNPGAVPLTGPLTEAGFLMQLGDKTVDMPLLAEVYTYPAMGSADVVIEAAVTAQTCGRELLGETLLSEAGRVTVTDLTLAMPDCDAVGDFLVLNNLVPDLTLVAAN